MFCSLDPVTTREALDLVEKLTNWDQFQSLATELISQNILIYSSNDADKVARGVAAPLASAYRLSTRNTTIFDRRCEIPALNYLLKHKKKLRKLWQENRDSA
jgi:hypothetical protein